MNYKQFQQIIEQNQIKFIGLHFTNLLGQIQQITLTKDAFTESVFNSGYNLSNANNVTGWDDIGTNYLILKPDFNKIILDPFAEHDSLFILCDIFTENLPNSYILHPRSITTNLESLLAKHKYSFNLTSRIEFFIFDSVRWDYQASNSFLEINSEEAYWASRENFDGGNFAHRAMKSNGYLTTTPVDSLANIRNEICLALELMGVSIINHAHANASAGQCLITTMANSVIALTDNIQLIKYVVLNTAQRYGKTATFMTKPIASEAGSYLEVTSNLFIDKVAQPKLNKYYLGGILHHIKALNAFIHPTVNSYKSNLHNSYYMVDIENNLDNIKYIDANSSSYLALSAIMLAGIDGIINKISPNTDNTDGKIKINAYACKNLEESLYSLNRDRDFLKRDGVFNDELIDKFIKLKIMEIDRLNISIHPMEFDMYYSI